MAKRKEEEVEGTTPIPEPEVTPEAEKTYSKAEYEAEIARIQEEDETLKKAALDEQHRKLNAKLTQKGLELQQLRQQKTQPKSTGDDLPYEAVIGDMKEREAETGVMNPRRIQLEAELVERKRQRDYEGQIASWQSIVATSREELNQLITDAGKDPSDDSFIDIDIAFDATAKSSPEPDFTLIKRKLNQILKSTPKVEEKKVEKKIELKDLSDEAKEELLRQATEEDLKTHNVAPSGASGSDAEWKKQWASGELPATKENIEKARRLTGM